MTLDPLHWPTPIPIAHRGSRLLWPENTMEAFTGAMDLGYRHLETDLHLTGDGVLVCIHDATVDRTTNGVGPVESYTLRELKGLDAGYRHSTRAGFPHRSRGLRIPTLEEVITSFPGIRLVLDLKTDGLIGPLVELIDRHQIHDRVIVGSFSERRLADFREACNGRIATSTGPMASRLWVLASRVGRRGDSDASALQLPVQIRGVRVIDQRLVDVAHAAGLQIHVWTVNRTAEMQRLLELGVDGIVTDRPDLLKSMLVERGEWRDE